MNLLLRAFLIGLFNKLRRSSYAITDTSIINFRAMPHDLALRDHLPNYRYFSFYELAREDFFQKVGMPSSARSFGRLVASQDITYLRQIRPFEKFDTHTNIVGWDEKYCYFLHRTFCHGKLTTVALVKEAFLRQGSIVAPAEVFGLPSPAPHEALSKWREFQNAVKQLSS